MSYDYYGFPKHISVGQKRAKAEKALAKLRKKDPGIQPITLDGAKLAYTWWGKAWNTNLEKYADFAYRLERGRSYVRHGAILDLRIRPGLVTALVQGSMSQPYKVEIKIAALAPKIRKTLKKNCKGRLVSLQELLEGKFPRELDELFTDRQTGLFPAEKEINFSCSCPDWASLCKHVAAVLYGIGSRLDREPALFFELRQIDIQEFIAETVKEQSSKMLQKTKPKGKNTRILSDENLSGIFGVDIDTNQDEESTKEKTARKPVVKKKPAVKKVAKQPKQPKQTKGQTQTKLTDKKVTRKTVKGIEKKRRQKPAV